MNLEPAEFMFILAKEIKRSFESPVILLTLKDYADGIINTLVAMRAATVQNAQPEQVAEMVNTFHLEWLQAVQDIENFKNRAKDTPKETILKTFDYTIECVKKRHKCFQRSVEQSHKPMTAEEKGLMQADLEIIGEMCEIINYALNEKQKCLSYQADKGDFYVLVMNEVEELMIWLDRLYDHLAVEFSKVLHLKMPVLPGDLVKTLQKIIDDIANSPRPEAEKDLACKDNNLDSAVRDSLSGLEMEKVIEKIKHLEDRINRLQIEDSSAVMALEHKTIYLEERLLSLQYLKFSLNCLKIQKSVVHEDGTVDEDQLHIFNHLLPRTERCRLVEQLVNLWNTAITGRDLKRQSIISIFSSNDLKEVFSDDLGHFSVDKYGRKIYTLHNDEHPYQVNEQNELVPVKDDKNVYFFDECGRYFFNDIRDRVYKAHASASEYVLNRAGLMLKVSEFEDGLEYRYDNLGRYYIDAEGVRIYKDKESNENYQHDGLGNLVQIRDTNLVPTNNTCPLEPMVTEESIYLMKTVGTALRKCIAEVVAIQPPDPIIYLADMLVKYRQSIDTNQKRLRDYEEMMAEREHIMAERPQSPSLTQSTAVCLGESVTDLNFTEYET